MGVKNLVDFDFLNKLLQEDNIHRGQLFLLTKIAFNGYKELCIYA